MTKTVKIVIAMAAVALVAIVAISANTKSIPEGEKQTVKIGLSLPLSGGVAFLGEPAKKAAELALKDAGETKYDYDLVFEDDQFNPVKSATTSSKLINIDKVLAIISFGSGTGNAINPIAETGKTAHFALASDPTVAKGEYNYIHWTPAFEEGRLLAQELIRRGITKVSIIDTNHPGTLAVTESIKEALNGSNVQIVSYDLTNVGEKDFKSVIGKMKQAQPEIVILEMFSPEIEIAARQMKELGVTIPTTSVETFEWSSNPELFEGNWFVSDTVVPEFATKYKAEYGVDPQAGSSYVYDLVAMLIKIQEKSNNVIAPADLPAAISKMGEWKSPVFGEIEIDNQGFFLTDPSVKIIENGKAVLVK